MVTLTLEPSQPSHIHTNEEKLKLQNQQLTDIEIESGLDFVLSHLEKPILFPRTIMTKKLGYQRIVYSKEEALDYFLDSELADCRINAYPNLTEYKNVPRYKPIFLFLDIDRDNFKTDGKFELALYNTLKNIKEKLQTAPTVLFTGGGYHIYQPVEIPTALENISEFQEFDRPSEQFLRFAKDILSNNRADKQNNPSFRSCLLRIPESINSKYGTKVKIVKKWNGIRAPITRDFIEEFRTWLIQKKIDDYNYRQKIGKARRYTNNNDNNIILWIEKLLNTPIADFRKNSVSLILAPYLVNIKELSYQESFDILVGWLHKCDSIKNLDFNPQYLVKTALNTAIQKNIPPMKQTTLKNKNLELYHILQKLLRS
jgi:Primase X